MRFTIWARRILRGIRYYLRSQRVWWLPYVRGGVRHSRLTWHRRFLPHVRSAFFALVLRWRGIRPVAAVGAALCLAFSHTFWVRPSLQKCMGLSMALIVLTLGVVYMPASSAPMRCADPIWMVYGHRSNGSSQPDLNGARCADAACLVAGPIYSRNITYILAGCAAALIGYSLVLYLPIRNGIGPGFHWGSEWMGCGLGSSYGSDVSGLFFRASHGRYAAQRRDGGLSV